MMMAPQVATTDPPRSSVLGGPKAPRADAAVRGHVVHTELGGGQIERDQLVVVHRDEGTGFLSTVINPVNDPGRHCGLRWSSASPGGCCDDGRDARAQLESLVAFRTMAASPTCHRYGVRSHRCRSVVSPGSVVRCRRWRSGRASGGSARFACGSLDGVRWSAIRFWQRHPQPVADPGVRHARPPRYRWQTLPPVCGGSRCRRAPGCAVGGVDPSGVAVRTVAAAPASTGVPRSRTRPSAPPDRERSADDPGRRLQCRARVGRDSTLDRPCSRVRTALGLHRCLGGDQCRARLHLGSIQSPFTRCAMAPTSSRLRIRVLATTETDGKPVVGPVGWSRSTRGCRTIGPFRCRRRTR